MSVHECPRKSHTYPDSMNYHLGMRTDHGVVIKKYGYEEKDARRYSPPSIIVIEKEAVYGDPDPRRICTSHVERNNLTMRMSLRRLTRLTNAHSKKWENHEAMWALYFAWYNFVRKHSTIGTTPAVESGLTDHEWTMEDLLLAASESDPRS